MTKQSSRPTVHLVGMSQRDRGAEVGHVEVKGLAKGSNGKLGEALATIISVDNVRALVTMGELER